MSINKLKTYGGTLDSIFEKGNDVELSSNGSGIAVLPIEYIKPRANQPRKHFDKEKHKELIASIKEQGVIQPIVVRMLNVKSYEIIVGERRWRASQEAGLTNIPVIIKDYTTEEVMIVALMENIHRQDLNPLEEAYAINSLISEFSLTQEQVAHKLGKARTTVTNLLRLLNLNNEVKTLLDNGLIDVGHARTLLTLEGDQQIYAANIVIEKSLSVRQTEELVHNLKIDDKQKTIPEYTFKNELLIRWESTLSRKFNSKVKVQVNAKKQGRVLIQFDDIDALNEFVEKVVVDI